jgi:hypothetical protein
MPLELTRWDFIGLAFDPYIRCCKLIIGTLESLLRVCCMKEFARMESPLAKNYLNEANKLDGLNFVN